MKNQKTAYLLAALVVIFWSTSATAFKIGLQEFNNLQLLFWSSLSAMLIIFVVVIAQGKISLMKKLSAKQILGCAAIGVLNPFLYYIILFKAYSLLPAQVAQPLNYIWPIVLVLLSALVLKQKIAVYDIIALIISLIGVALISSQGNLNIFEKSNPLGVVLALTSSILWASYWILNLKFALNDEIIQLFCSFTFSTIFCLFTMLATDGFGHYPVRGLIAAAFVGAFEMGITFILWLKALQKTESTAKLSTLLYLVPFTALIIVNIVLHEEIVWTTIVGLLVIIGAIFFQKLVGRKKIV